MMLLKVFRQHVDGYTDSEKRPVSPPVSASSSSHTGTEEHSLVEAEQFVGIIMQQQHMSSATIESMPSKREDAVAAKGGVVAAVRSINIVSQPQFQLLRSPPAELKQHFDE